MEPKKKNEYMKIGTFNIKKKTVRNLVIIVAIIAGITMITNAQKKKEARERYEAEQLAIAMANNGTVEQETISIAEQIQRQLREQYGEPPEGFEWDYTGNLVALSAEDLTYEDVVYTYIRALSILDFATAQRYSSVSKTMEKYEDYYGVSSTAIADYYNSFLRKQFKFALTTVELNSIEDIAVFADGTVIATINISCLDLTDKEFWEKDREKMFNDMRVFDETESDSVKKEQYVYDYIFKAYEDEVIGKRDVTIEVVVSKGNGEGWLISDDSEFMQTLSYENGVDVAQYIFTLYGKWLLDEQLSTMTQPDERIPESTETPTEEPTQINESSVSENAPVQTDTPQGQTDVSIPVVPTAEPSQTQSPSEPSTQQPQVKPTPKLGYDAETDSFTSRNADGELITIYY